MMEKISGKHFSSNNFSQKQQKLQEIRKYIEQQTDFSLASLRLSGQTIVAKAANSYEATEIRLQMSDYLENNNIKITS